MVLVKFRPNLARLLISQREEERSRESSQYLEEEIQQGRWNCVAPIWITPNLLFNGLANLTAKPFIMYNGHHRLEKAIEHKLPIRAYVRYTLGNPELPEEEKLEYDIVY